MKEESEKAGLKVNIQKAKITVTSLIISLQIDWGTVEALAGFIILGSKITPDSDHCHEIKRHLLLERKTVKNLDSILKAETSLYQQRSI